MGYAVMSARKIMLTNRINTLNFQLMNLNQLKMAMSNETDNLQRLMNMQNNIVKLDKMRDTACGVYSGDFSSYSSEALQDDYMNLFDKYAQVYLVESDVDAQIKQIETQVQAATKELEKVEEGEKNAIDRGTPKYA